MQHRLASAGLMVALGGLLAACSPVEAPGADPSPQDEPTEPPSAAQLNFAWTDAGSGWSPLAFTLIESSREATLWRYGDIYGERFTLSDAEVEKLWSLARSAGVETLAESNAFVETTPCCQDPGYQATLDLSGAFSEHYGGQYWTSAVETDAQALLRANVQSLVEAHIVLPPPGEYEYTFTNVGGYAGVNELLTFNAMTGASYCRMAGTETNFQALRSEMLFGQSLLLNPDLWALESVIGSPAADGFTFSVTIDAGGSLQQAATLANVGGGQEPMWGVLYEFYMTLLVTCSYSVP